MSTLTQVIFYSLIGGVFSLLGGFLLLSNKSRALKLAAYATPFAAGALLAAAFTDLLKEASHIGDIEIALQFSLLGILLFFALERFLRWFHHHHEDDEDHTDPTVPLIIIGDTIHNFIDGIAIAAGFLVDPTTGVVVTLAVAAHEIPQEIGDFGLLLSKGLSRRRVLLANLASALATTVAAVIFFQFGQSVDIPLDAVLGLVAGLFIYIAVSDIIPSIHAEKDNRTAGIKAAILVTGVILVGLTTNYLHQYIELDDDHGHENSSQHSDEHDDEEHSDDDEHEATEHSDEETDKDHVEKSDETDDEHQNDDDSDHNE